MSLSNMKVFNVKPDKKPRVKRLSNGNFVNESYCVVGSEIAERYVDYILFSEASEGSIELKWLWCIIVFSGVGAALRYNNQGLSVQV